MMRDLLVQIFHTLPMKKHPHKKHKDLHHVKNFLLYSIAIDMHLGMVEEANFS